MKRRILGILITLCMVICIVPAAVRAEEGDTDITEVNLKGLSNELWSYKDMTFATVDDDAGYTITEQAWNASGEASIKPDSANLKPKAGTEYTFIITLEAKDGYVFPIKSESAVFYDGTVRLDGTEYDGGAVTVSKDGKTLKAILFPLTKTKGVTLPEEASVGTEDELIAALQDDTVGRITLTDDITLPRLKMSIIIRDGRQLILDLNGYVLDLGENTGISVGGDTVGIMTIMDSNPNAPHKFTPNADGLWVWDKGAGTGTETVLGGVITDSSQRSRSSAINVGGSGGKVIMDAGNIVGYRNGDGGAVSITAGGQFTMNGGSIMGCYASGKGGAVYVVKSTFTLADGVIKSCYASGDGGAVYVAGRSGDGIFTMTGGSIADCTDTNGSAIYLNGGKMNAGGGTVDGTVVLDVNSDGKKGVIQGSGSNATLFKQDVINIGEIGHGTFSGTVTLGTSMFSGAISGGIFNGPVTTASEGEAKISGGIFNKTVTINRGEITNGIFNKDVVVGNAQVSFSCTTLTGGIYNGLIINKSTYAKFAGAHSPLGIVGEEPIGANGCIYRKVTFDLNGGNMDYPERYFLDGGNISDQIVPAPRAGYFFGGWYNGENKWDHGSEVTGEMTLTAHWIACDHSGHTGAQPDCTTPVICTECGGTIAALGHDFSAEQHDKNEHWNKCSRCDAIDGKEPHDWDNGSVTVQPSCTTSGEKVYTCTDCGFEKIETIDARGHNYGEEWQHDAAHHWHSCGDCDAKDSYAAHSGGTATCTEKAVCEVCGEAYGELDAGNHKGLTHVEAKEATKEEEGNIEYWYCKDCGKYFADENGEKEIDKASTVIPKVPQTGDSSNLILWFALLFISGGVCTVLTVKSKKSY